MTSLRAGPGPIRVLFVANRGEIAVRIERTCRRLGIAVVIPHRDLDPDLDLLDRPAVVAAAVRVGADAVHPGYGFLSEQASFAEAVLDAGLRWVGPPPGAMRRMGDKASARRLAASLAIPVLPGYDGDDQSDETLLAAAGAIGYPVLVKPAGGGGGKGMRVAVDAGTLSHAIQAARREAGAAFGDDRLLLERHVTAGRHVEVQVLFDALGHGVHLGERDCSLQRRYQKVLEETPAPNLDPAVREALAAAALRLAGSVGYVSAGTCEFLVGDDGWWFLEMNTRLQVEHPVTELVTGRDLVADQLRVAAGDPLGFEQADVRFDGHAIEVRLYAEDPAAGFLPATGHVVAARWPEAPCVRVETGIAPGDEVTGRFDPMLAKVAACAPTRDAALELLADALDETVVLGLTTNLRFLRWLVRAPVVREGRAGTNTIDGHWPPPGGWELPSVPEAAWRRAARELIATPATDPWRGGWRVDGLATARLQTGDEQRTVRLPLRVEDPEAGVLMAVVDGDTVHVDVEGRSTPFRLAPAPDVDRAAREAAGHSGVSAQVRAPMPGRVLAVHASPGAAVAAGDPVVTLEAMKMEHAVSAPRGGVVDAVLVRVDEQVGAGQVLAVIGGRDGEATEGQPG
ncbi:MAG: acetyl/propionyl-CoA carboxylase subunit alpha [Chloroflexi bacterium]|nr:acetyl/propionyl-CoA carboxylase subunit alpha [Chloroflexota bacterium]